MYKSVVTTLFLVSQVLGLVWESTSCSTTNQNIAKMNMSRGFKLPYAGKREIWPENACLHGLSPEGLVCGGNISVDNTWCNGKVEVRVDK